MNQNLHREYECLGLSPDVGISQIREAYREMKALYHPDSLATYSLFEEEERSQKLQEVEESYRRICREVALRKQERQVNAPIFPEMEETCLDPQQSPGLFLKHSRERAGISLKEVATRTKISARKLEHIEAETFSRLPPPVFLRGFVDQFARLVGLPNPEEIAKAYLQRYQEAIGA